MNNIITCPKCHRVLPISDYFTFKDKQLYTGMCKSCVYKRMDVNDLSTFLPFMELFDIPYIESQWNRLIALAERSSPFDVAPASRVFGKYLSLMKLRGYIGFSFKDSEELNKREHEKLNIIKEKDIWKAYEIYYDDNIKSYIAIPFEKNGNRKAIASTCNVEINDIVCTGLFTTKYMEEEYE